MPKSSPDRLAQALRANLKRRKASGDARPQASPVTDPKVKAPEKSPENGAGPFRRSHTPQD